jgi:predicted RNase H-like nuclease (RuvC/YqgF family)
MGRSFAYYAHWSTKEEDTNGTENEEGVIPFKQSDFIFMFLQCSLIDVCSSSSSKKVKSTPSSTENKPFEIMQNSQFDLIVTATSICQLKEEVSDLKKLIQKKNQELLKKDKEICELKAQVTEEERSHRQKVIQLHREYQEKCDDLQVQLYTGL